MNQQAAEVLDFWFGPIRRNPEQAMARMGFWFKGGKQQDAEIRQRFGDIYASAISRELAHWRKQPEERLALILVLDQFSRQLHRGQPEAFAHDHLAVLRCRGGRRIGFDKKLGPLERAFFYMPLQHAESQEVQDESVHAYQALVDAFEDLGSVLQPFLDSAREHRDIIDRFGRFPHRNQILDRPSTSREKLYLDNDAPRFGQG